MTAPVSSNVKGFAMTRLLPVHDSALATRMAIAIAVDVRDADVSEVGPGPFGRLHRSPRPGSAATTARAPHHSARDA